MKTLYNYMAFLFIAMAMFSACADDMEYPEIPNENPNNEYVTLSLNFQSQNDKVVEVGRSAATTPEKKLYDLHFYVFDTNGNLTGYKKVLPTGDDDVIEEAGKAEKISIRAKSGESYIYGVANINSSTTYYLESADLALLNIDEGDNDEEYYRSIESSELTRTKFLGINFKRRFGDENAHVSPNPVNQRFLMSGYINDGATVEIPKGTNGTVTLPEGQNIIKLYRILAKNTLTITNGKTASGGKFTPKSYRLCNVPTNGALIPKAGINNISTYLANNVTRAEVESNYTWNFEGNKEISFYFPENLQVAKNAVTTWKDREKNLWDNDTKTFTNAADKAAYIEIYGDYVDSSGEITANVSYTIHFGDFSKKESLGDFNVIRNHNYLYKVTINGVDDIKVEATTGEDSPYAEGLVVNATNGKHFNVDAHYEARVMTFKKADIQALRANGTGYILNIKTPFGHTHEVVNVRDNGIYTMTGHDPLTEAQIFDGEVDYNWMKFVKNTDGNTYPCQYPGDHSDQCMNVFELLKELYDDAAYTEKGNEEAYYTCFIDEYYYANKSWPEYVNQEPRTMLIANDLSISTDGKSLYAEVAYSISQRAITSFYQTDYIYPDVTNDLVVAFGSEIIDEEDVYHSRLSNSSYGEISNQHDWNAWTSAYETNKNKNWYSGNVKSVEGIQPLYTTVAKACMSRNRDLNGNGTIEQNEVKWYLPAVEQYRALFYGQNSLNPDAYLISQDEMQEIANNVAKGSKGHEFRTRYHYFTSSDGDKSTFWPEEGLTNNPMGGGYSWAELVRCIRTLESKGDGLGNPEVFYTYNDETHTFYLDGIKQTRDYTVDPLANHNEIDPLNNLYNSFVVAQKDLRNTDNKYDFLLKDITGPEADPCSRYASQVAGTDEANYKWRTPNQKELALMVSEMDLSDYQYGTRTKFSGDDKWDWHTTPGFWSDATAGGRINVGNENGKTDAYKNDVRIRCVRDNKRQ